MKLIVNARFLTQHVTGVQRYAIEICLELKRRLGNDVLFVAPNDIIQKEYAEKLNALVIGSHKGHLWEQWDLPRYLRKKGNPLLLCLCNTAPLWYNNKIVTVHDVAFEVYPQTFSKSFLFVYKFMIPRIMRSAKKVITVSEFSKDEMVKYYHIKRDNIVVVPTSANDSFRKIEDVNLKEHKYFLAVSSLNYRKNFLAVLEAFEIFEKQNKESFLYIIGDIKNSSFKEINIEHYKENPRIKFLGRVTDEELVRYYSNATAFIFPSLYEGFGLPPLEAQMCGCPVLVADIPPLHEVVADSGIYCNPHDTHSIADGMEKVLEAEPQLRLKGYDNAKKFSFKNSATQIHNIITESSKNS